MSSVIPMVILSHISPQFQPLIPWVLTCLLTIYLRRSVLCSPPVMFFPFALIGPLLSFLQEQGATCTTVVPDLYPKQYWWPIISSDCVDQLRLAQKGDIDVLRRPSRMGFVDYGPIPWDLWVFRVHYAV